MKKIEAKTLEEAYAKAAKHFDCSVTDLEYEIVQHPSSGFLGIGAKNAVIVAACNTRSHTPEPSAPKHTNRQSASPKPQRDKEQATQPTQSVREERPPATPAHRPEKKTPAAPETSSSESVILNGFFDDGEKKPDPSDAPTTVKAPSVPNTNKEKKPQSTLSDQELSVTIEERLGTLMHSTCFDIDTVEVDVIDGTAYIFIDGEDAALLIGKEGYRYNALSYLLYNWIHNEYGLFIKLEIAQFLASQQEMIRNYIQPVIEHVHQSGWGKTRPLDGILAQIALEQLREEFPHKYVAIKRTKQGERYILINEFNKRS